MQTKPSASFVQESQLKVVRNIGAGSFSTVWLCWHTSEHDNCKAKVAVKYVRPEVLLNKADVQLFLKEVNTLQQLQHKCIVKLLGVGPPVTADVPTGSCNCSGKDAAKPAAADVYSVHGPFACYQDKGLTAATEEADSKRVPSFLVQEYMPGGALNRVVAADMVRTPWERSAYTLADSLRWSINIADALVYLHSQEPKIIHRDLKLSNILLTSTKCNKAEARVADFGLHTYLPQGAQLQPEQRPSVNLCCSHHVTLSEGQLQQLQVDPKHCCCKTRSAAGILSLANSNSSKNLAAKAEPQLPVSLADMCATTASKDVSSICCCELPPLLPAGLEPLTPLLGPSQKHLEGAATAGATAQVCAAAQTSSMVYDASAGDAVCRAHSARMLLRQSSSSKRLRFLARRSISVPHLLALSMSAPNDLRCSSADVLDTAIAGDAATGDPLSASKSALILLQSMMEESCQDALWHRGAFGRRFRQQYRQLLRSHWTYPPTVDERAVCTSSGIQPNTPAVAASRAGTITGTHLYDSSAANRSSSDARIDVIPSVATPAAAVVGPTAASGDAGVHLMGTKGDLSTAGVGITSRYDDLRQSLSSVTSRLASMTAGFLSRDNSFASLVSLGEGPAPAAAAAAAAHNAAPAALAHSKAGSVVLCDVVEDALFQLTPQTGSLVYMAPEVYRSESYNEKADVFSFGVMLYELLHHQLLQLSIGAVGNDGQAALELYAASMAEEGFRPPISPKLPVALQELIRACWAQLSEKRPSMSVVLDQLISIQKDLGLDPATAKQNAAGTTSSSWFSGCFGCTSATQEA